jgi:hypothetical protein
MDSELFRKAFEGLRNHPEATLAGICVVAGVTMATAGVNLIFSGGLPMAIYLIYYFRMVGHDRHTERMSELEVQKLEKSKGLETRRRSLRALERRRKPDGTA